jgi:hypothetical protein
MGGACSKNGEKRNAYRILLRKQKGRHHWEDQDVCGWTILKWILREIVWDGLDWIGLTLIKIGTSEHDIEPSGSMKCREVLEWLHN